MKGSYLMHQDNPHDFFSFAKLKQVPVIASFDAAGQIKPIYVSINGEVFKIQSCHCNHNLPNTFEFKCRVIDNDCLKPLTLTYYRSENAWMIPG